MKLPTMLLAVVAACGPSARGGADGGTGQDAKVVDAGVDVVFVLDTSSSMGFVLSQLEAQIAQVVSSSNMLAANAHFGLVVLQGNHFIDTTGLLEAGKVHTDAASLQTAFRYRTTFTNHDRNPGDGPGGLTTQNPICEENSLDALYAAASSFPWRPNATRVVILATDDTFDNYGDRDNDGLTDKTDFPREGHYRRCTRCPRRSPRYAMVGSACSRSRGSRSRASSSAAALGAGSRGRATPTAGRRRTAPILRSRRRPMVGTLTSIRSSRARCRCRRRSIRSSSTATARRRFSNRRT